jgi:hypothetical protein
VAGHVVGCVDTPPGGSLLVLELLVLPEEEFLLPLQFFQLILEVSLEVYKVILIKVPLGSLLRLIRNQYTFSNSNMRELLLFSISLYFCSSSDIFDLR